MSVITAVATRGVRYPAGPLHAERFGPDEEACQVTLVAGDGTEGHAIARAHSGLSYRTVAEFVHGALAPLLLGRPAGSIDDVRSAWDTMMRLHLTQYVPIFPVSAVDVALWDLLGQTLGTPVAALLSDRPASHIPVYASIPHEPTPHDAVTAAVKTFAEGFDGVKVHGTADVDADLQVCRALRHEFGDDRALMYDGGQRMARPDADRVAQTLGELAFAWFEEPFGAFDTDAYYWLTERCDIPIAAFETAPGGPGAARWAMQQHLADYLMIDCYWKGGLTGANAVVETAAAAGQQLIMHHGGSATMNLANVHLVAAHPQLGRAEFLVPYGQYDPGITPIAIDPGAGMQVPDQPGLGVELDAAFLDAHTIAGSGQVTRKEML